MALATDRLLTVVEIAGAYNFVKDITKMVDILTRLQLVQDASKFEKLSYAWYASGAAASFAAIKWGIFAGAAYEVSKATLTAGIEFENMSRRLVGLYQNAARGKQAFDFILQASRKSPYSLQENVDAFTTAAYTLGPAFRTQRQFQILQYLSFQRHIGSIESAAQRVGLAAMGGGSQGTRGVRMLGISPDDIKKFSDDGLGHFKTFQRGVDVIFKLIGDHYGNMLNEMTDSTASHINNLHVSWQRFLASFFGNPESTSFKKWEDFWAMILDGMTRLVMVFHIWVNLFGVVVTWLSSHTILGLIQKMFGVSPDKQFHSAMRMYLESAKDLQNTWKNPNSFPGLPSNLQQADFAGKQMSRFIREIIGGGEILKLGIKPSELPGIAMLRKNNTITVHLVGQGQKSFYKALEDLVNEVVEKMNRHGINMTPSTNMGF